jgi:hypothetical protein
LVSSAASSSSRRNGSVELVRELDPAHDLYLQHHRLDGHPVLPMAMAMELMAEVAAQGWPELEVAAVRDLQVLQGIVLRDGVRAVRVVAHPQGSSSGEPLTVGIEIVEAENPKRVHYRATVELDQRLPQPPAVKPLPLVETRAFPMNEDEAYRRWLFHGPLFQGIKRIECIGADGIKGFFAISSPQQLVAGAPEGHWLIDPVMVDSGLQLLILWAREHWDMTPLPSRVHTYRRFGLPSSPQIQCEVHIRPETGGHVIHADLFFLGVDGQVLGILEDMEGTCSKALNRLAGTP